MGNKTLMGYLFLFNILQYHDFIRCQYNFRI